MRLTQKQETFCLKYFEIGNATEAARIAGYSPRTLAVIASQNLTKVKIVERIDELRQKAEDASIATVIERKQVLTEIVRGRLGDFVDAEGEMVEVNPESLSSAALQELKTAHFIGGKEGRAEQRTTTIKLHNPIHAIAELNKMEKIYEDGSVVIDNRTLTINVLSEKGKDLTRRLLEGERTD